MPKRSLRKLIRGEAHPIEWALARVALGESTARQVWTTTLQRGWLAAHICEAMPNADIVCWTLDRYIADAIVAETTARFGDRLRVWCEADWPATSCDLALIPCSDQGEEALAIDVIQGAYGGLDAGGKLCVAAPSRSEGWLREQLKSFSKHIKVTKFPEAIIAAIVKGDQAIAPKNCWAGVVFRDQGRLITIQTRPGVFAHRKLDVGARQLMNHVALADSDRRLLEIGCGSGAVALALKLRRPELEVVAIDSNPRAIDCTRRNFLRNGIDPPELLLSHNSELRLERPVDVVVANPPYFSNFRIAEIFCEVAAANLKLGGNVHFVAKNVEWYHRNFSRWFSDVQFTPRSRYWVISGRR